MYPLYKKVEFCPYCEWKGGAGNMPCAFMVKSWRDTNAAVWDARDADPSFDGLTNWFNKVAGSWADPNDGQGVIGWGVYLEMVRNFLYNRIHHNKATVEGVRVPLEDIRCPTYVIQGPDDEVCPYDWGLLQAVGHAEYLKTFGNHLGTMIGEAAQAPILEVALAA